MKIRNDFVSNSSSSSYIITTKESQYDLINHIVKYAGKDRDGKVSEYWHSTFDNENREFLELRFNHYVKLVLGQFTICGTTRRHDFMEEEDEQVETRKSFSHVLVRTSDINNFIKDGKPQVDFKSFITGNCPPVVYSGYKVFEITQDSIDFTRWLMSNCDNENPNYIKLCEFFKTITRDKYGQLAPTKEEAKIWKQLVDDCAGLVIYENCSEYRKTGELLENGEPQYKDCELPLSELLDRYEQRLKDGNRIYRICFGHSGEGTDWSSYVWTSNYTFCDKDQDKFKFEYDLFW